MTLNQLFSNQPKIFKPRKRRGVAEIIGSLMLISITVVGAVILTTFLDSSFVQGSLSSTSSTSIGVPIVKLIGYDTRDSNTLLKLTNVNNQFGDGVLCGGTCSTAQPGKIPSDGGSEFIVIQIENQGMNSVFLDDVFLNNVDHVWDPQTSGKLLDAGVTSFTGKYPADGKFSILKLSSPLTQGVNNEIQSGQTVNILIKLGLDDQDITLEKSIRVLLNVGAMKNVDFAIESGSAR